MPLETRGVKPETARVRWKKVTLVGVGLLGGSLGLALKQRRLADCVVGFVRRSATARQARRLGAVDSATQDLAEAVSGADLVVLCTPLAQMEPLMEQMLPAIKRGAIVTDVGSVKESVVRDLEGLAARVGAAFIGSHPMAGSEQSGVGAGRADLFEGAVSIVTPTRRSSPGAVRQVEQLWRLVGARPLRLSPRAHDELVSRSSHLPQAAAAALAHLVLDPDHPREQALLCAGGFRDTTRIASGSPEMWRDIALANRKNLSRTLSRYIASLQKFQRLLESGNAEGLSHFFAQAKERRDGWVARAAAPAKE